MIRKRLKFLVEMTVSRSEKCRAAGQLEGPCCGALGLHSFCDRWEAQEMTVSPPPASHFLVSPALPGGPWPAAKAAPVFPQKGPKHGSPAKSLCWGQLSHFVVLWSLGGPGFPKTLHPYSVGQHCWLQVITAYLRKSEGRTRSQVPRLRGWYVWWGLKAGESWSNQLAGGPRHS